MRIYLFLETQIYSFIISSKVEGGYNFDINNDSESKLINIESLNGKWYLCSTSEVGIMYNGNAVPKIELKEQCYYYLLRDGIKYLIYTSPLYDNSFTSYSYEENLNINIGNSNESNLAFSNSLIKENVCNITLKESIITLQTQNTCPIYVNNRNLKSSSYIIKNGDCINIYGLKLMFLKNVLLINNPCNLVKINYGAIGIMPKKIVDNTEIKQIEIKDIDLYQKDEYFSKAPRLRRTIKEENIKFSPPPKQNEEKEMPLLLTVGPMFTMGIVSVIMLFNTINRINSGQSDLSNSWPQLAMSGAMIISIFVWPTLTRIFNEELKEEKKKELKEKYTYYLLEKRKELTQASKIQKEILLENLLSVAECRNIIQNGKVKFWDKRIEQNDFLEVRIGFGNERLKVKVEYPEEGFTIEENELKKEADALIEEFKEIHNVPIAYSFYKNKITDFMGDKNKCYGLINNIILQLITFYSYEDIKIVLFTNEENKWRWEYLKYLNHSFNNSKNVRFFSSNYDDAKNVCDFLNAELINRLQMEENILFKPYYVIIVEDYDMIKRHNFIKMVTELDRNLGFSMIILEDSVSKLPSKCNNFILMGENVSGILTNSFEEQQLNSFKDEIVFDVNMMEIVKRISNIPIEFQNGSKELPEMITFLEMEKVGKVEQLNIINRWEKNNCITSIKAEIGVDEEGNTMYLDLHEKQHGPHGLIAGMTGSGKSEFIITYILSMAINYSPDDVAFILIDYKGGGLAFAFENKTTGMTLPHLAGTITNLDKAEMDRTLVSIDSEIKRRQKIFNQARDALGESTIDIYKYQRYFKEGKLLEPIPHLFIICDEFAELKSQQPDFMNNLISVARIGRSLGVHLILATQKPSGVVNDQIWSNTKFRVCLKVQDASDSKEMLKRPEAASLKQTGRFYLQVGYDEYFALGQSAWCGARYYPCDKIIKQVDKSINFINDYGTIIKSIQSGNNVKVEAKGEQLGAIIENIIDVSKKTNKKAKRLWLNNIEAVILINDLIKKYNVSFNKYDVEAIIGEYDAPERQEQGILKYSLIKDGNTLVIGNDGVEREGILNSIIYSTCIYHDSSELSIYIVDYGSESLRMYETFPQVGGIVCIGDDEKFKNLFKLILQEIKNRKKIMMSYGSIEQYNKNNDDKLPQILFILNNYESIIELYPTVTDDIASLARDCERYGIYIIITSSMITSIGRRVNQGFKTRYALHLTDTSDYYTIFNAKCKIVPKDILGRGIALIDTVHEFQTASIVSENQNLMSYINTVSEKLNSINMKKATLIPSLPEKVDLNYISKYINSIEDVPVGVYSESLNIARYNFLEYKSTIISASKINYTNLFIDSLLEVFSKIRNLTIYFVDFLGDFQNVKERNNIKFFNNNYEDIIDKMIEFEDKQNNYTEYNFMYIFYGISKAKTKLESSKLDTLFQSIKKKDNSNIIFCDSSSNIRAIDTELWFSKIKNNMNGIWIGKGFGEQQCFRIAKMTKEMTKSYTNNYGFCIKESNAELMKVIELSDLIEKVEEDEE